MQGAADSSVHHDHCRQGSVVFLALQVQEDAGMSLPPGICGLGGSGGILHKTRSCIGW